jgi:hypothetical protein
MADTVDLKSTAEKRKGSNPLARTIFVGEKNDNSRNARSLF